MFCSVSLYAYIHRNTTRPVSQVISSQVFSNVKLTNSQTQATFRFTTQKVFGLISNTNSCLCVQFPEDEVAENARCVFWSVSRWAACPSIMFIVVKDIFCQWCGQQRVVQGRCDYSQCGWRRANESIWYCLWEQSFHSLCCSNGCHWSTECKPYAANTNLLESVLYNYAWSFRTQLQKSSLLYRWWLMLVVPSPSSFFCCLSSISWHWGNYWSFAYV